MMDRERLLALHTLSGITAIGGFLALFGNWAVAMTIMPLHVYFAVHGARAAGTGRLASTAIALAAALPGLNTLVLVVVNNRLAKAMLAAGVPREAFSFRLPRKA